MMAIDECRDARVCMVQPLPVVVVVVTVDSASSHDDVTHARCSTRAPKPSVVVTTCWLVGWLEVEALSVTQIMTRRGDSGPLSSSFHVIQSENPKATENEFHRDNFEAISPRDRLRFIIDGKARLLGCGWKSMQLPSSSSENCIHENRAFCRSCRCSICFRSCRLACSLSPLPNLGELDLCPRYYGRVFPRH